MTESVTSPNIYGIETEYSCLITLPGNEVYEIVGACHTKDSELGLYFEPEKKGSSVITYPYLVIALQNMGININQYGMLSNGGRLYIDPSGPEYATPETASAEDAVHRMFDGDEILFKVLSDLSSKGIIEEFQINRRAVDHNRTSRGTHLNTATVLPSSSGRIIPILATLNVVKGAIFGSGGLLINEAGETEYHHSPRLSITTDTVANYGSHTKRPLVRLPFKPDGDLYRIETVTSDTLNFAWPIRASMVLTNAVVKLVEIGEDGDKIPLLRHPERAAQIVGRFGCGNQISIRNANQEFVVALPLDVLRDVCELILEVDQQEDFLDVESKQVIPEIVDVSDKMADDMFAVADQVESVARLIAFEKKMEKGKLKIGDEKMCRVDYAWDWIGAGIAEGVRKKNVAGWKGFKNKYSVLDTKNRLTKPPKNTRARIRGEVIRNSSGNDQSEWDAIDFVEEGKVYVPPLGKTVE